MPTFSFASLALLLLKVTIRHCNAKDAKNRNGRKEGIETLSEYGNDYLQGLLLTQAMKTPQPPNNICRINPLYNSIRKTIRNNL